MSADIATEGRRWEDTVARAAAVTDTEPRERPVVIEMPGAVAAPVNNGGHGAVATEPARGFRRRLERFRGSADSEELPGALDSEAELRLQLMLLREENARLKSTRHQPSDSGTMIDRLRVLATPESHGDDLDEVWSVLGDCLVIREGLDQACLEIQRAVDAVRDRLAEIADRVDAAVAASAVEPQNADIRSA